MFIMLYNCNLQLEEIAWKRYGSIAVCAVDWRAEITFFFYHVQPCFFHETDKALWDNWTQSQTHCGKCEPFLEPNHKSSNLDESLGSKHFVKKIIPGYCGVDSSHSIPLCYKRRAVYNVISMKDVP